jgi:hypothetical protein
MALRWWKLACLSRIRHLLAVSKVFRQRSTERNEGNMKRSIFAFAFSTMLCLASLLVQRSAQAQPYNCGPTGQATTCGAWAIESTTTNVIAGSFQSNASIAGAANGYDTSSGVGVWGGS